MPKLTDEQILESHSPGVRGRVYIELQIVNCLLASARKKGLHIEIDDYDTDDMKPYEGDLKTALFDLDEVYLIIWKKGSREGWIRLIFGNNGYDLISDYSLTDTVESLLEPVKEVISFWGD